MSFLGKKKYQALIAAIIIVVVAVAAGYYYMTTNSANNQPPQRLIIATTTSTVDSGLMNYLKPYFDQEFHANMTWLYLGSGQAMQVASMGDADILLVHSRAAENAFVASGNGTLRVTVMYNDFVIVGPASDPANVTTAGDNATLAFMKIAQAGAAGDAQFVSRGDNSGTNVAELKIWAKAGINVTGASWYLSTGSGMAPTLRVADQKQAYTMTDRATFLQLTVGTNSTPLSLTILCQNDNASLLNPYGIILLNSTKYPNINSNLATDFLLFMISPKGQQLIGNYTIGGIQVFHPIYGDPQAIGLPSENSTVEYLNSLLQSNGLLG